MAIRYLSGINVDSNTLFVDSTNNRVGIGTGSPTYTLDVVGSIRSTGNEGKVIINSTAVSGKQYEFISIDTGNLGLYDGTSYRLWVSGAGNVGIGTTSPAAKLDVAGDIRLGGTATYNSVSVYNNSASGGGGYLAYQNGVANAYFGAAGWYIGNSDTGAVIGTDSSSRPIRFYTNTERMRITGGGNVGIGTTNPAGKLSIEGDGTEYSNIVFKQSAAQEHLIYASTSFQYNLIGSGGPTWIWGQQGGSEIMRLNNTGLGIGTDSPSTKLHTVGNIRSANAGNTVYSELQNDGVYAVGTDLYLLAPASKFVSIYAGNAERMRIASTGATRLNAYGSGSITGTATYGLAVDASGNIIEVTSTLDGSGTANYVTKWQDSNTLTNSVIYDNGTNVGIGTTSPYGGTGVKSITVNASSYPTFALKVGDTFVGGVFGYSDHVDLYAEGYLNFETGGSEKMRITSAGNVGIGTTSPDYKLSVNESTTNPIAYFGLGPSNASSRNSLIVLQSGTIPQNGSDTTGEVGFLFKHSYGTGGVNGTANGGYIESIRESVFGITSQVNTALIFGTSAANTDNERMRINSAGNVGIGNSSPQANGASAVLDVGNGSGGTLNLRDTNTGIAAEGFNQIFGGDNRMYLYAGASGASSYMQFYTNDVERMRIHTNGNFGVGTTNPIQPLTVSAIANANTIALLGRAADNATRIDFYNNGGDSRLYTVASGNGAVEHYADANIPMVFSTNAAERMRITAAGNVGIGTTSPGAPLHVYKSDTYSAIISRADWNTSIPTKLALAKQYGVLGFISSDLVETTNDTSYIALNYKSGLTTYAEGLRVYNNGNVGIGTTAPSEKLELSASGNIYGKIISTTTGGNAGVRFLSTGAREYGIFTDGDLRFYDFSASAERMRITSGGNVGIGTTAPGAKLDIVSTGTGSEGLRVDGASGGFAFVVKGGSDYTSHIRAGATIGVNYFTTPPSNGLIVEGNVGIGTTSPNAPLHIVKDLGTSVSAVLRLRGSNSTARTTRLQFEDYNGTIADGLIDFIIPTAGSSTGARLDIGVDSAIVSVVKGGNVGIGTTSPAVRLDVVGANSAEGQLYVGNTNVEYSAGINFTTSGTNRGFVGWRHTYSTAPFNLTGIHLFNTDNSNIVFGTNNVVRAVIDTNGNFGINNTAPGSKLDVISGATQIADFRSTVVDGLSNIRIVNDQQTTSTGTSPAAIELVGKRGTSTHGRHAWIGAEGVDGTTYRTQIKFKIRPEDSAYQWSTLPTQMVIDGNGSVGINNASPSYTLDVYATNTPVVRIQSQNSGGVGNPRLLMSRGGEDTFQINVEPNVGVNFKAVVANAGYMDFYTGTDAITMRVSSSKNLLIGTTTDSGYKLRVNGTSYFDGLAHFGQSATSGSAFRWGPYGTAVSADTMLCMNQLWSGSGWTILNSGVGTTYLNLGGDVASPTIQFGTGPANTAATTKMIILNNGDVGIGTTSPIAKLHISSSGTPLAAAIQGDSKLVVSGVDGNMDLLSLDDNSTVSNSIGFGRFNSSTGALIHKFGITTWANSGSTGSNTGDRIAFNYGTLADAWSNSELMTIKASGNVGIGTTAPSAKLHISGSSTQLLVQGNNYSGIHQAYAWVTNTYFGARYDGTNEVYGATGRGAFKIVALHDADNDPQYLAFYGANAGTAGSTITWNTVGFAQDEDGNVGIGTTSPASLVHIDRSSSSNNITGTPSIIISNRNSTSGTFVSGGIFNNPYRDVSTSSVTAGVWFENQNSPDAGSAAKSSAVVFGANSYSANWNLPTERMRITQGGFVGIGTSSPSSPFTVANDVRAASLTATDLRPQSQLNLLGGGGDSLFIGQLTNSTVYMQSSYFNATLATYPIAINPLGGNVGIGTTAPSQKLHVVGNAWINRPSNKVDNANCTEFGGRVDFNNAFASGESGYITFRYPTYNNFLIGSDFDGNIGGAQPNIQFGLTNGTSVHMHIQSSNGKVGIGTTSPGARLVVQSDVSSSEPTMFVQSGTGAGQYGMITTGDSFHGLIMRGIPSAATTYAVTAQDSMSFFEYGSDFRFYKKTAVGPTLQLDAQILAGEGRFRGDVVAYYSFSDERLKDDVKPLEGSLDKVLALQGVSYKWNSGERKGQSDIGLIAQQVEKVIPEVVREKTNIDGDTFKSVNYEHLVGVLIESIKELTAKVEQLEAKLK